MTLLYLPGKKNVTEYDGGKVCELKSEIAFFSLPKRRRSKVIKTNAIIMPKKLQINDAI